MQHGRIIGNIFIMKLIISLLLIAGLHICQGVRIHVDTSQAPELAKFGRQVKATLEDWYPYISRLLHSPTFQPIDRITIYFDPNYKGAAYANARERRIVGSVKYYRVRQDDVGSMIHELAHVIQQYKRCHGWVKEGIADWVRYYHYEPNRKPGKPGRGSHYSKGYGVAAYFLNWINLRYAKMIYWINKDCREGTYKDTIFPRLTGKTVGQHWNDMLRS